MVRTHPYVGHADLIDPLERLRGRWVPVPSPLVEEMERSDWRRQLVTAASGLFGTSPFRPLAQGHALIAAGDACFAVSLAGSLFFSASVEAARPRIALYLLITMLPFAVVAPLVGPFIDRLPGGQRLLIALTSTARGIVALILAGDLRTLAFYPLAFAILVLGKTYSVAKNTVVPRLVDDPDRLIDANSRLSRLATYSGTVASLAGVAVLNLAGGGWTLRIGGALYLLSALFTIRLPRPAPGWRAGGRLARHVRYGFGLQSAAVVITVLRATVGFVLFLVAMALKRSGEPTWFFGAVLAAHGAGGLAGTFIAPRLRRSLAEEPMLVTVLAAVGTIAVYGGLSAGRLSVAMLALVVGMGANVGRQAFDSLVQRVAADMERGRLFARFETRFQVAWVLAALAAVVTRPPLLTGLVLVGSVTLFAALWYLRVLHRDDRAGAPAVHMAEAGQPAPERAGRMLLASARTLAVQGDAAAAVVTAAAAIDAVARRGALHLGPTRRVHDAVEEVQRLRRRVMDGADVSSQEAERALELARWVIEFPIERRR